MDVLGVSSVVHHSVMSSDEEHHPIVFHLVQPIEIHHHLIFADCLNLSLKVADPSERSEAEALAVPIPIWEEHELLAHAAHHALIEERVSGTILCLVKFFGKSA